DCRYQGQSHELRVPWSERFAAAFHDAHETQNGYARPSTPIEIIAVRVTGLIDAPIAINELADPDREEGVGPKAILEPDCTIWVPDGWRASRGKAGALLLRRDRVEVES